MNSPPEDSQTVGKVRPQWRRLVSAVRLLTQPASSLPALDRRRSHLLAWLLLVMILLTIGGLILVLIVDPPGSPRRNQYLRLILILLALFVLAYGLNRAGHHRLSAGLTILCAVAGPWGSLIVDPSILQGDVIPLTYVVITVMLASFLLRPLFTILLAGVQLIGLMFVSAFSPATASINWPSLLALVFFTSVLSILANLISQHDLEQIDRQTRQLAVSEAQLRELAIRDHLTNLFNRRYLEETLEREVQRAARKGHPLGVIMLDIDHFKHLNDNLGHAAGDQLFQRLGELLSGQVRSADIACRYGGDEFVLILPEASGEVTRQRAELLRNKVKKLHLELGDRIVDTVTISLGVAVFPEHGPTGEATLEAADAALYRAKREGRDRVVVADKANDLKSSSPRDDARNIV